MLKTETFEILPSIGLTKAEFLYKAPIVNKSKPDKSFNHSVPAPDCVGLAPST